MKVLAHAVQESHPASVARRIDYLDGLRGVAILLVVGYHYYFHFTHDPRQLYPYGDLWSGFLPFVYGCYGVQLFFAISGFVIALSLERCHSIGEFAVRRFARLWPTMLLCSLLTFGVLSIWPGYWPQTPANFLPSLSFIDGQVWNRFIPHLEAQWIDGSYWSLFVEVRFYALAAIVYFISPRRFMPTLATVAALLVASRVALYSMGKEHWAGLLDFALIPSYLPWFLVGVAALADLRSRYRAAACLLALAGALLFLLVLGGEPPRHLVAFVAVVALLFVPSRVEVIRRVLSHPCLAGIGVASYSLYLLHQNAGITFIVVISGALALQHATALAASVLVIGALLAITHGIYRYWETPMNRAITERLASARSARASGVQKTAARSAT
jgi:peptidoglycan/LPS O-acetylase OafA/YrhL